MKISREQTYTSHDSQVDYMSIINELQNEYGTIYWNTIEGQIFIYRPLGRLEYRQLLAADISDIEKEDTVCQACLLHPENYDFDDCAAGIPTILFNNILKNSFLDSIESKKLVMAYHRAEMQQFDNHITCIISEAFPNLDIEEIESWDMAKTAKYLSRAEWKLNVLRQIPIDYEQADKLMENEWYIQHSKPQQEQENEASQVKTEELHPKTENSKIEFKVETLEERQKRLSENGGPRKKTPAEIAELKRRFPEINWDSEVDPSKDINAMNDAIDTRSVALREGF